MTKINKIVMLGIVFFICNSVKSSPIFGAEENDLCLEGGSPRKRLYELLVPLIRRHSIGTYVALAPTLAVHIQPTLTSPNLARRADLPRSE